MLDAIEQYIDALKKLAEQMMREREKQAQLICKQARTRAIYEIRFAPARSLN